ncbi:MAG: putative porin [Vicinamibacterales bacterium]|nr:putative porin [Vicinamibacterales bacterium]
MKFGGLIALVYLLGVTSTVAAQDTEQTLRDLISAERQRITILEAELAERDAVLMRLSARLDALDGTKATPPQRFEFYADSLVRLATLHQGDCDGCPDRTIGRLRLRFGAEGRLAPGLRAVFGLSAGELNDPNSVYQTLGGNLGRKVTTWDRAYVSYRPARVPGLDLTAGKFPYTWLRSSMTFDVDFYPEGLSERFSRDLTHAGVFKNASIQGMQIVVNEQPSGPDTLVIGGQAIAGFQLGKRGTTRLVLTGMDLRRPEFVLRSQLDGSNVGVKNTNAIITIGGQAFYASSFRYANVIVEHALITPWESLPVTASVEYQRNLRAVSSRDTGTSFRLDAGRQQQRGDWGLGWHLFRVEQDAIMSALGESDWRAPSNVLQHRFAVTRTVHDHVVLLFTWYRGRTLDRTLPGAVLIPSLPAGVREPWANRLYFDVLYRY